MGLADLGIDAVRALRNLVEETRRTVEGRSSLERHIEDAVAAIHRSADSMDRHVTVLEGLATSLPQLTAVLERLSGELAETLRLMAPIEGVEREAAGLERLLHRHREHPPDADATAPPPPR